MIQRIKASEYMTDIREMTDGERKGYVKRVGEWLDSSGRRLMQMTDRPMALSQNIVQLSVRWTSDDCREFREGTLLLTALMKVADTWLPSQLYAKSANRAVRRIAECLGEAVQGDKPKDNGGAAAHYNPEPKRAAGAKPAQTGGTPPSPAGKPACTVADKPTGKGRVGISGQQTKQAKANLEHGTLNLEPGAVIPRPRHIDQYVHILPKKTQERAAKYGELMRGLEEARENMRRLMDDPNATDKEREKWAKTATMFDREVKNIRKELDAEWEKAVKAGRVTVDDLGQAHVLPDGEPSGTVVELTKEQKAKVKQLRNSLRDTRGPKEPGEKHDAYVKKWVERYREMVAIGGKDTVTEAVANAAKLYGIDIDGITE